ncbi:MAG TPA: TetR/AcrR family transcriptional regulator [Nocardioides sp.]
MPESRRTPRQLAREETLQRIKDLALAQLADASAGELSLRAIARELDVVSSAVYRYFASRDDLLTALIVDAYGDLADHLEAAADHASDRRAAWTAKALALRAWARAAPHRFALVYGSTIPGYRAPETTIAPAGRVVLALAAVLPGGTEPRPDPAPSPDGTPADLTGQLALTAAALGIALSEDDLLWLVGAFARVVGALTLELGGHFVGGFEPADELYAALVEEEAARREW